jgi:uncharacterized protein YndB with AHSA1/START domain
MKLILILGLIVGALVGMLLAMFIGGLFISRTHVATRSVRFAAPPDQLWSLITDHAAHVTWRPGLKSVERLPDRNGHAVWQEIDGHGNQLPMEVLESVPPKKYITRIDDAKLPFGGTWTWELSEETAGATRVRITEDGFIKPPPFRYIARLMGYSSTMDKYLGAMGKKLGQTVVVEP